MTTESVMVSKLLRQQAALAAFGTFALRKSDLSAVLDEAARGCAQGLGVGFSKICRFRPEQNDLIIEAGYGWNAGVVGFVVAHPDARTPQGRAFSTGEPFICKSIEEEAGFILPPFYAEHGIVSTIDVIIKGGDVPYGVLEIDSSKQQDHDQHDIDFLTGFANVLGEAVETAQRTEQLARTIEEMRLLVEEKNRLLNQKKILAEELQHRVRNNLQLVHGMLSEQIGGTRDEIGQRGLKSIARRVLALAQVYDQLLGADMTRIIDFGRYLEALCVNLAEVQASAGGAITLECTCDSTMLDLDVVTSLGLIVTELITNSFDHAFPTGAGVISVFLDNHPDAALAVLTIRDDGSGFVPQVESKRHGVGLVRRLSEQVGGSAAVALDNGTVWTITFPVASSKRTFQLHR